MKTDPIRILIAAGIAFFIGWGYYSMAAENDALSVGIVTGVEMLLAGIGTFCISFKNRVRSGIVIRTTSATGSIVFLLLNGIFAYSGINTAFFVINGVLVLLLLLIVNSVYRANQ